MDTLYKKYEHIIFDVPFAQGIEVLRSIGKEEYDKVIMYIKQQTKCDDTLANSILESFKINLHDYPVVKSARREKFEKPVITTQLRCPKCFSTSVTTGARGYSLLAGMIGANKTMNRCGKCGYKWYPKGL